MTSKSQQFQSLKQNAKLITRSIFSLLFSNSRLRVNTYIQVKIYVNLRIQNKVILVNVEVLE